MSISRSRTARVAGWAPVALILGALLLPAAALANSTSLWQLQGSAPQPGPAVLYAPPAQAPALENAPGSIWKAPPLLTSGASAYRAGEFLYQGYVYDDHGAKEVTDPKNPMHSPGGSPSGGDLFSAPDGTYDYPSGSGYDENAANLIELRVSPLENATAFRITLNTLEDPKLVATAIAIGGSEGTTHPFPFGSNVRAPAQYFLTIHGETAVLTDAETEAPVGPAPTVSVDLPRHQITVLVPHSAWNPGTGKVRLAAAVGLWDDSTGRYLLPGAERSATQPGGAGQTPNPPAFFDVAFRFNAQEPMPGTPNNETTANPRWWREAAQSQALAAKDISPFHVEVDFDTLSKGTTVEVPDGATGVPTTGAFDRIYASHFSDGQGADYLTGGCAKASECIGEMRGQLLPYAIYVPAAAQPASGYGLTLLLHSLSANYNQFEGSRNQSEFANRPSPSIVITPTGRGPDGWYYDRAGADVFEVWADVAARYTLNPAFTDIAGYSMGGYGTYKFSSQFPDLFARAQPTVGPPALGIWAPPAEPTGGLSSLTQRMLASVRNIPFLIWDQTNDELVPTPGVREQVKRFDELNYRYEYDEFHFGEHLTLAINDEFGPAAAFLGNATVDPNPPHVSYTYNPTMDFAADGTTSGHAYWLYGVQLRESGGTAPIGTIDVRSEGFGVGDAPASATQVGAGTLNGGQIPAVPYTSESKTWGAAPSTPVRDVLDITASNVSQVTIDPERARVDCHAQLNITTDGPLTVTLAGCNAPLPTVTAIIPKEGPQAGGTTVSITGTNFNGATAVKFGSTAAASFKVESPTSITAVSPAGTGTVDATVTTAGGTSATSPADQFTYVVLPTVVTEAASAVKQSSATLNATVNPMGPEVSECRFEYGTLPAYGKSVSCTPSPGSGVSPVAVSASVGGLSANTTYHFRISAMNSTGTSTGSDQTFTTLAGAPSHYYRDNAPVGAEPIAVIGWGTVSLKSVGGSGEVACHTVEAGKIASPSGGGASVGSTQLFATYRCESTTCPYTTVVTAENLPWSSALELEGSVIRNNTAGMRLKIECRNDLKPEASETFVGAYAPSFTNGTSALHPSFVEFDATAGVLEKEGSKGTVLEKGEGEQKILGYQEQELITVRSP